MTRSPWLRAAVVAAAGMLACGAAHAAAVPGRTEPSTQVTRLADGREARIQAARAKVEQARANLKAVEDEGQNPENWQYIVGSGQDRGRRYPKPEWLARLEAAQARIVAAEEELKKIERELF